MLSLVMSYNVYTSLKLCTVRLMFWAQAKQKAYAKTLIKQGSDPHPTHDK